jgi:hypothetical protein
MSLAITGYVFAVPVCKRGNKKFVKQREAVKVTEVRREQ